MNREEVLKNVLETELKVRRMRILPEVCTMGDMEMFVFMAIEESGGRLFVSEIARVLNSTAPNVSRLLRAMEAEGKIEREIDSQDRRNIAVKLTEAGRACLNMNVDTVLGFFKRAFSRMTEEDLLCYTRLLEKVSEAYNSELKEVRGRKQGTGGKNVQTI